MTFHLPQERFDNVFKKRNPHQYKLKTQDKDTLIREAGAINATVTWFNNRNKALHISVEAPRGFVWASTKERTLEADCVMVDSAWIRDTVQELLAHMQLLYIQQGSTAHEDTCECDQCEQSQEDPELADLDFE